MRLCAQQLHSSEPHLCVAVAPLMCVKKALTGVCALRLCKYERVSMHGRACLLHICKTQELQGLHSNWPLVLRLIPILPQLPQQLAQPLLVLMMQRYILGEERLQISCQRRQRQ